MTAAKLRHSLSMLLVGACSQTLTGTGADGGSADAPADLATFDVLDRPSAPEATVDVTPRRDVTTEEVSAPAPDVEGPDVPAFPELPPEGCWTGDAPLDVGASTFASFFGFAASGDRFALLVSSAGAQNLVVLDRRLRRLGSPRAVASGTSLLGTDAGFVLSDASGFELFDRDGAPSAPRVPLALSSPLVRYGDVLVGLQTRALDGGSTSVLVRVADLGRGAVTEVPVLAANDARVVAFGPSEALVQTGRGDALAQLDARGATAWTQPWDATNQRVAAWQFDPSTGAWWLFGGTLGVPGSPIDYALHLWGFSTRGDTASVGVGTDHGTLLAAFVEGSAGRRLVLVGSSLRRTLLAANLVGHLSSVRPEFTRTDAAWSRLSAVYSPARDRTVVVHTGSSAAAGRIEATCFPAP